MVSLAILAILSTIAVVAFKGSQEETQLQAAADRLLSDLRLVRTQALQEQHSYSVAFNAYARTYQSTVPDPITGRPLAIDLDHPPYQISGLALNLANKSILTFNSHGEPSPTGSITLTRAGKSRTIIIEETGRVDPQ